MALRSADVPKIDMYNLEPKVSSREILNDPKKIAEKMAKAKDIFIRQLKSKYISKKIDANKKDFVDFSGLIETLDLANIDPPITKKDLDEIIFSIAGEFITPKELGYEITNPNEAVEKAASYWQNLIINYLSLKPSTATEIASNFILNETRVKGILKDLAEQGLVQKSKTKNANNEFEYSVL